MPNPRWLSPQAEIEAHRDAMRRGRVPLPAPQRSPPMRSIWTPKPSRPASWRKLRQTTKSTHEITRVMIDARDLAVREIQNLASRNGRRFP